MNYSNPVLARQLRDFMIEEGLPPHVAEGFLWNYQDESGLDPGINEKNPLVPGSRGGFGIYQLTGPRRVAYEKWAKENGYALDDGMAQARFQMQELRGTEKNAFQRIMATNTPGEAAAAVATYFLRPSEDNLRRRVQRYTGDNPPTQLALANLADRASPVDALAERQEPATEPWSPPRDMMAETTAMPSTAPPAPAEPQPGRFAATLLATPAFAPAFAGASATPAARAGRIGRASRHA